MSQKRSIELLKFYRKYPTWNSFAKDRDTVEIICAQSNLGHLKIKGDQAIITSRGVRYCVLYLEPPIKWDEMKLECDK